MAEFRGVLFGVVPILVTPFDETGAIDEESLRNEVDFAHRCRRARSGDRARQ